MSGPAVLVLDLRVRDAKRIEVSGPLLERRSIADVERQVIEADSTLVKPCAGRKLVGHESDGKPRRVEHAPYSEARPVDFEEQLEAQHLGPPLCAARAVSDREVDVPEAFDPRSAHAPHHFMSSR
jgi:hypothetical protein